MPICDPSNQGTYGCWENDCNCPADGCEEFVENTLTGERHPTKCYKVKTGCLTTLCPCNGLMCDEGANPARTDFEVGFKVMDRNDPAFNDCLLYTSPSPRDS